YRLDINMDRVEDVLIHRKILELAKDSDVRPVYHVRFLENLRTKAEGNDDQPVVSVPSTSRLCCNADSGGAVPPHDGSREYENEFEPCSKLEDLNLDVRKNSNDIEKRFFTENFPRRQENSHLPIHEVIFSTVDKPKLLCQLSALLSDIGLNIREAHVFSTTDGYSLDVFVVDGWPVEDTEGLCEAVEKAIARSEGSWYRGVYLGQDVAVKFLRSEHLNEALEDEFAHEVAILREVQHRNVVRFVGACTKSPHLCIVTGRLGFNMPCIQLVSLKILQAPSHLGGKKQVTYLDHLGDHCTKPSSHQYQFKYWWLDDIVEVPKDSNFVSC
ncbi:non-specific serine,threonine protein kinase, partial [Sarracenia purpurea var. burkii]